jgi:IQ domain-containing protein H
MSVDLKYDPKSYPEILDTYSLHHFIIRKGKTLEETPEFVSFKRTFYNIFGKIGLIIRELEKFA